MVVELEFVDDARCELVDLLERAYLRVAGTGVPEWISIEAPSGWGKSRLVHELYRRLAAAHQDDGAFWPPSLAGAMAADAEGGDPGVDAVRKRTFPEQLSPATGATPAWLWWGIGCDHRYGTPLQALANDIGQIERLTGVLEQRWRRQASVLDKTRVAFTRRQGELVDTAVGESVSAAAGVLGAAVPGLGFVVLAAKWGIRKLKEPSADRVEVGLSDKLDLVDEVAPGVARFAREVVPVVIFVEDLHRADDSLVELLSRLMNTTQARVLLVTTAWPGQLDGPGCAAHELPRRVPQVERWASHGHGGRVVSPLATESAAMLVEQLLPGAEPDVRAGLVARYPNPLALQLACRSQALRQALTGRGDAVSVVGRLPREVRQLYEMLWDDLPAPMRTLCMVSVLSAPATVSAAWGAGDDRWDADAVLAAAAVVPWLHDQLTDLEADLALRDPYGWVRSVSEWLRRFHEPVQREVALAAVREQYDDPYGELAPFIQQMAERLVLDTADPELALHHARLLVALQAEGFIADTDAWWNAVQHLAGWLADQPDIASVRELVVLTTAALSRDRPDDELGQLHLDALRATALAGAGRVGEAIVALEALLADRLRVLGPDHPDTLTTRNDLAAQVGDAGRVGEAIVALEALLADRLRVLGPDHPDTLNTRAHLAARLAGAGRVGEAIVALEALLADQTRVLGPDHPHTLNTRAHLAARLAGAGRVGEAITALEALLADQTRVLGPDHPHTLNTRAHLAAQLAGAGRVGEAITALEALLADRLRVLGPDHPHTLTTRNDLAAQVGDAGRVGEAITALEALLADRLRVLGPDHPHTLNTRAHLAAQLADAGRVGEAITAFEALLADQTRVLGPDHPHTLTTRNNLAAQLAGRVGEAITALEALLADQTRVLGPDHPHTLTTRNNLAAQLADAGCVGEAITAFEALLADQTRVLGPDHPHTLTTRNNLAAQLADAGRVGEAITAFEALLADQTRVLGPDHPHTLTTRRQLEQLRRSDE